MEDLSQLQRARKSAFEKKIDPQVWSNSYNIAFIEDGIQSLEAGYELAYRNSYWFGNSQCRLCL